MLLCSCYSSCHARYARFSNYKNTINIRVALKIIELPMFNQRNVSLPAFFSLPAFNDHYYTVYKTNTHALFIHFFIFECYTVRNTIVWKEDPKSKRKPKSNKTNPNLISSLCHTHETKEDPPLNFIKIIIIK